jgi:hypothetical protein
MTTMTKTSKIRFAIVTALVAIAVGLPAVTAIANAPSKSTVRFSEPTGKTTVLPTIEITGTVPYVNPAPIAKHAAKKTVARHAVASHVNQVVYTELEQGGRPDADFVRRF